MSSLTSGGGIGQIAKRAAAGFVTGGLSEYAIAGSKVAKGDVKGGGMGLLTSGTGAYGGIAGAAGGATEKAMTLPEPPAVVPSVTTDSPAVQLAGAAAAQKAASRRGFRSTILSSMAQASPALRTTLGA